MNIKAKYKPELVASGDARRWSIQAPYLQGGRIVAMDGKVMLAVPVQREAGDVDGYVSADALKEARNVARGGPLDPFVDLSSMKEQKLLDGRTIPRPDRGTFPLWEQVVPSATRKEISVRLDVELLRQLTKALGASQDHVTLHVSVDGPSVNPIRVEAVEGGPEIAVIMPVRR